MKRWTRNGRRMLLKVKAAIDSCQRQKSIEVPASGEDDSKALNAQDDRQQTGNKL